MVRVLPDLPAVDKSFDYLVPTGWPADQVRVGTRVRAVLKGRRVGGWVVADDVSPPEGVVPRPLSTLSGWGPDAEVIELARWAAWRWAGRMAHFLATASPTKVVRQLPEAAPRRQPQEARLFPAGAQEGVHQAMVAEAVAAGRAVVRLAPAADPRGLVGPCLGLLGEGSVLVLVPSQAGAGGLAAGMRRRGWPVALLPGEWAKAAAGGRVVVGTRAAAWAPAPGLAGVIVLDAHDEAYQEEKAPTWEAWVVAAERAARAGAPCLLVSPCPTLSMLAWGQLVTAARADERRGWPALEVVDRRRDDPRLGLFSSRLVTLVRSAGAAVPGGAAAPAGAGASAGPGASAGSGASAVPGGAAGPAVVCVLNRTGRARLLACAACGELARCEVCEGALSQPGRPKPAPGPATQTGRDESGLVCRRCGHQRPALCAACGSQRLKVLRAGVSRVREELEALAGTPVGEVTGASSAAEVPEAAVLVGTEAVLHRVPRAGAVVFLDLDQELLAPRYQAGEATMALLSRAARLVGGRAGGGRLVVQTRLPGHEVLDAVLHADPGRSNSKEAQRRSWLRLPPASALALVSGAGASAYVAALKEALSAHPGVEVLGPSDGTWLVRAPDHGRLCDALSGLARPRGRLRVEVDPRRV